MRHKPVIGLRRLSNFLLCASALLGWSTVGAVEAPGDRAVALTREAYRFLHENPERGKKEIMARDYIRARLEEIGGFQFVDVPDLATEVIAVLDTGRPGQTVALRADMDARPLDSGAEPMEHDPRSRIDGLMHNCGHDAHSAMLLGAAARLAATRQGLRGKIVFVFQPAEEVAGGADDIVKSGVLSQLGVSMILAQHVADKMPVGTVSITPGRALAGSNSFKLVLEGASSHASRPYLGSDLAVTAAKFVQDLANLPARGWDIANRPVVLSVTKINTNSQTLNTTPTEVVIEGTIRALEPLDAPHPEGPLQELIKTRVEGLKVAYGAHGMEAKWEVRPGAPPTKNDEQLFDRLVPGLASATGLNVVRSTDRFMAAEDFAYYTRDTPALYFALGIAKDGLGQAPVHTPEFTIHPDALPTGVTLLTALARAGTQLRPN